MEPLTSSCAESSTHPRSKHRAAKMLSRKQKTGVYGSQLTSEERSLDCVKPGLKLAEAQKLCKYVSANDMTYEGIPAAIDDLEKALRFLHLVRSSRADDCYYGVWKPGRCVIKQKVVKVESEEGKTKEFVKSVLSILNKVTSSNLDTLMRKLLVKCLNIDTEEHLACVAGMVYEKAVKESIYAASYGEICQRLAGIEVLSSTNPTETINFRKLLLKKCQREFANTVAELLNIEKKEKEIEENKNASKKEVLDDELEELTTKYRNKTQGNIWFIIELFKLEIISTKVIHLCILRLLDHPFNEVSLECLCHLLKNAGEYLETPPADVVPVESVITQTDGNVTLASAVSVDGADRSQTSGGNPSLRNAVNDDMCIPLNSSGKMSYDRNFLLKLHNNHGSMKKPEGLSTMEIMRDKAGGAGMKRIVTGSDFPPPILKMPQRNWIEPTLASSKSSGESMDSYFFLLDFIVNNLEISNRIRFMIQDVIDLRKNQWEPRRKDNKTKTSALITRSKADDTDAGIRPGPGGWGISAWRGRVASGGMSQPMIGGTSGDGERGFDSSVRSQTLAGPSGGPLRPLRETLRHLSKDSLQGIPTLSEKQIARKAQAVLDEFFTNENMENTAHHLKVWLHPSTVSTFIDECVMHVLERNRKERRSTGALLKEMVKRNLFTTHQLLKGFELILQAAEDLLVDIPRLWEYLAQFVEPIFEEGVVNFAFLGELAAILSPTIAPNLVVATLEEMVNSEGGVAEAKRLWILSNTSLETILPGVDVNAFVDQHKKLEFVLEDSSSIRVSGVVKSVATIPSAGSALLHSEFQRNLEQFLRMRKRSSEEIRFWIQTNQFLQTEDPLFIRSLATALVGSSIDGNGFESKLNTELLRDYTSVLSFYVGNVVENQLLLLLAIEWLVAQRQLSKGLLRRIFEIMNDGNVLSKEGFELWMENKEQPEREGQGKTLKSSSSFLSLLK